MGAQRTRGRGCRVRHHGVQGGGRGCRVSTWGAWPSTAPVPGTRTACLAHFVKQAAYEPFLVAKSFLAIGSLQPFSICLNLEHLGFSLAHRVLHESGYNDSIYPPHQVRIVAACDEGAAVRPPHRGGDLRGVRLDAAAAGARHRVPEPQRAVASCTHQGSARPSGTRQGGRST